MTSPTFISTPDRTELTPQWLSEALRRRGLLPTGNVESMTLTPIGTGQSADSFRVAIEYDHAFPSAPASLVVKLPSEDPNSRRMGLDAGMYEREALFYDKLAPQLGVALPLVVHSNFDQATGGFVILLEDLSPARQGDQLAGCSVDEAALVMEQAAALHSGSWKRADLAGQAWLGTGIKSILTTSNDLPTYHERFRTEFAGIVDDAALQLTSKLLGSLDSWRRFVQQATCLWHRDFRCDNVLFDAPRTNSTPVVLDWQTVAIGPGICDVSQYLGGSLPTEVRRANEHDLLRVYHSALCAGGVSDYSFAECELDYRRSAAYSLYTVVHAPVRVKRTARGDLMWKNWATLHSAQATDLETIDALQSI